MLQCVCMDIGFVLTHVLIYIAVDLVEVCLPQNCNVGLLAYSPLAGGSLSGKYLNPETLSGRFNLFPGYMARYNKSLARVCSLILHSNA